MGRGDRMGRGKEQEGEGTERGGTRPHPFTPPIHISGYAPVIFGLSLNLGPSETLSERLIQKVK